MVLMLPAMGIKRLINHSAMPTTINAMTIFTKGIVLSSRCGVQFKAQTSHLEERTIIFRSLNGRSLMTDCAVSEVARLHPRPYFVETFLRRNKPRPNRAPPTRPRVAG